MPITHVIIPSKVTCSSSHNNNIVIITILCIWEAILATALLNKQLLHVYYVQVTMLNDTLKVSKTLSLPLRPYLLGEKEHVKN